MKLINPATEEVLGVAPRQTPAEVEAALAAAGKAFGPWAATAIERRGELMRSAAAVLRKRKAEFAATVTREMGKPIVAAESEVEKCAVACDYFAREAAALLAPTALATEARRSYIRYDPIGCVLAIMPWNFPFWQVFRFAAPNLMAGNVALLKHASNVPACADAIESVFREAGFPAGVFARVFVSSQETDVLVRHPVVRAVTLTGSEKAGAAVAAEAGRAMKKTVMELGGSDPFLVLGDADVARTARAAAAARCVNSGQSCIAAKRFIVVGAVADAFEQALAEEMRRLKVGDPIDRATEVGPMARLDLLEELHELVIASVKAGAALLTGGRRLPRTGYFYEPTVLAGVTPDMPAAAEETFGPVAAVMRAGDVDDAVRLANDSRYGLGASVWTADLALAEQVAARLDAGSVFIDEAVRSDPRLPFGGVKASGWGRELAEAGIREFTNVKTVWAK